MHSKIEEKLKAEMNNFFDNINDPEKIIETELMYRAFKARMMLELAVEGYANQGVVNGHLVSYRTFE